MPPIRGFLAMEYYGFILNRSFVLFSFPEGLYGWKFRGLVSAWTPQFFLPLQAVAEDTSLTPGTESFQQSMRQRGSFFIPRNEITSVDYDPTPKWGMGPVPHSGKIHVHLASGKSRELILLGNQNGEAVRSAISSGTPISTVTEPNARSY